MGPLKDRVHLGSQEAPSPAKGTSAWGLTPTRAGHSGEVTRIIDSRDSRELALAWR